MLHTAMEARKSWTCLCGLIACVPVSEASAISEDVAGTWARAEPPAAKGAKFTSHQDRYKCPNYIRMARHVLLNKPHTRSTVQ